MQKDPSMKTKKSSGKMTANGAFSAVAENTLRYRSVIHTSAKVAAHMSVEYTSGNLVCCAAGIEELARKPLTARATAGSPLNPARPPTKLALLARGVVGHVFGSQETENAEQLSDWSPTCAKPTFG